MKRHPEKHGLILAGALAALGALLGGCAHEAAPAPAPVATPTAPTASKGNPTAEEAAALAKAHGFNPPSTNGKK